MSDTQAPGSLGTIIGELLLNPPGETVRRTGLSQLESWEGGDWNALLKIANELADTARSEINRRSSAKSSQRAIDDCIRRTGMNPIDFHRAYVAGLRFLSERGEKGGPKKVRETIIDVMRPDLDLSRHLSGRERDQVRAERERLSVSMKSMIEKPPAALRPYFELQLAVGS
ncbi:MAG TPA: hypothetical protein VFH89_00265 [Sphingomicrobium sp.]|nr:hypothetical protein [Sphingomicrobium sp.]